MSNKHEHDKDKRFVDDIIDIMLSNPRSFFLYLFASHSFSVFDQVFIGIRKRYSCSIIGHLQPRVYRSDRAVRGNLLFSIFSWKGHFVIDLRWSIERHKWSWDTCEACSNVLTWVQKTKEHDAARADGSAYTQFFFNRNSRMLSVLRGCTLSLATALQYYAQSFGDIGIKQL